MVQAPIINEENQEINIPTEVKEPSQDYSVSVSFEANHLKMPRGIYLSQVHKFNKDQTEFNRYTTIDLRLRSPYRETPLSIEEIHSLEHVFSLALRIILNSEEHNEQYIPVSIAPMGCQTGFYIIILSKVELTFSELSHIFLETLAVAKEMKEVPARDRVRCGNFYTLLEKNQVNKLLEDIKLLVINQTDYEQYDIIE